MPEKDLWVYTLTDSTEQEGRKGKSIRIAVYGTDHEHTGWTRRFLTHRKREKPEEQTQEEQHRQKDQERDRRPPWVRQGKGRYFKKSHFDEAGPPVQGQRLFVKVNNASMGWTIPAPGPRHVVGNGDTDVKVVAFARKKRTCTGWTAWEQVEKDGSWVWEPRGPGQGWTWEPPTLEKPQSTLKIASMVNDWWVVAQFAEVAQSD